MLGNAAREVWIRDEVSAERNRIEDSVRDGVFRSVWLEASCRDQLAFVVRAKALCSKRATCLHVIAARNPRLDEMEIRKTELIQLLSNVSERWRGFVSSRQVFLLT